MRTLRWLRCLILTSAWGSAIAAAAPGGGQLLQQVQPPSASPQVSRPELTVEQPSASGLSQNQEAFVVQRIEVTGITVFPAAALHDLVASSEGKSLTLADLYRLAARITQYYQHHGYLLARAYVPAQTLHDGTVKIAVVEARYGAVVLHNSSGVSSNLLKATLAPLRRGNAVDRGPLDRSLLLLSDIPGVVESAVIRPGATLGTSDLLVNTTAGAAYSGYVDLDDAGNRYTGRARLGATLNINSPLHHGDRLTLNGVTSGPGLNYGRVDYQYLINGQGTQLGAAFSDLAYHLTNGGLSDLRAHGTADVESLMLSQPFIRGVDSDLYVQIRYDHTHLLDQIDVSNLLTERHINSWTITPAGDYRNAGGITNYNSSLTYGSVDFDNASALSSDTAGPHVQGDFVKFTLSLARLQQLSSSNALYLSFQDQLANQNLDPSEQFILGGPGSVRAYGVTAAAGSQGRLATIELRHQLDLSLPGSWQAIAFLDSGYVRVYKNTFSGSGSNSATLSGVGVGLNWFRPHGLTIAASIATPVGHAPALVGHAPAIQGWVSMLVGF